jgi:drug/metabolite transporter (DMT)-like permease
MSIWLFAGFATNTISLRYTTVNRCAFITAMNVIFVPILAAIFGQRIRPLIWIAAITALIGCALLCGDGAKPNIGDLWALGTAITWAMYIWRMEKVAGEFQPLAVSVSQIICVAVLDGIWTAAERPPIVHFHWLGLIYLGLVATALTAVLQATGQRVVPAPQAAVIFTLEPVFAAIFSFAVLGEHLAARGLAGAAMIILAAIASQWRPDPG